MIEEQEIDTRGLGEIPCHGVLEEITMTNTNILEFWGITVDDLSRAILENGSLRGMVFGYVAEIKLRGLLEAHADVDFIIKDDDHDRKNKADLRIRYRGQDFRLESKSLQTNSIRQLSDGSWIGKAQVDGSDRRTVKFDDGTSLETTLLRPGDFDVLAVNCFAFEQAWFWAFASNRDLPRSSYAKYTPEQQQGLLASLVTVTKPIGGIFRDDLFALLDSMIEG
jgi:hypothetical protein